MVQTMIKRALSAIVGIPGQAGTLIDVIRDRIEYSHSAHEWVKAELTVAQQQLSAEREAHAETKQTLNEAYEGSMTANERAEKAECELASALDKLDKLTRTIDCGCGEPMALAWYCSECRNPSYVNIESLQVPEESEGSK